MTKRTSKTPDSSSQAMTLKELKAMMIQAEKDAVLISLLYVSRKLGEVEGVISTQVDPDKTLVDIQEDLNRLYDTLIESAGVEQVTATE